MPRLRALVAVLLLALVAGAALADGVYVRARQARVPPHIEEQRALIVHRDGVETMTVELSLDAEGQTFGWIVPLPAKPTSVEQASRAALDTLDLVTEPKVRHATSLGRFLLTAGLFLGLIVIARSMRTKGGVLPMAAAVLMGLVAIVALVPNLQSSRLGAAIPGITADAVGRVGSYDVTVLEAERPAALDEWLEANGLAPLPDGGERLVADHIADGWVFVAVRLTRSEGEAAQPHPLRVAFPSERIVYPMRLTALAGGETLVRLHVVADGRAEHDLLATDYSDSFQEVGVSASTDQSVAYQKFQVRAAGDSLALPELVEQLWGGCVVTRLEGRLAPEDMTEDLFIDLVEPSRYRGTVYSAAGAWDRALDAAFPAWALVLLVLLFVPAKRMRFGGGPFFSFLMAVGGVTLVFGLVVVGSRIATPTVDVTTWKTSRGSHHWARAFAASQNIYDFDAEQVADILERGFGVARAANPYTGRPLERGDGPGDWTLVEDERGLVFRIRTESGAPSDRVLRKADDD